MSTTEISLFPGAGEVLKDALGPSAKIVGRALGAVTWMLIGRNTQKFEFYQAMDELAMQKNLKRYAKSLEEIGEDNIVSAAPEIAKPILDRFAYVANDELGQLYSNLLASASSLIDAKNAHPAFISIIEQLSPDEAKLLANLPSSKLSIRESSEVFIDTETNSLRKKRPTYSYAWRKDNKRVIRNGKMYTRRTKIKTHDFDSVLSFPMHCELYIDHLERLGLLSRTGAEVGNKEQSLIIAPFGHLFLKACRVHTVDPGV